MPRAAASACVSSSPRTRTTGPVRRHSGSTTPTCSTPASASSSTRRCCMRRRSSATAMSCSSVPATSRRGASSGSSRSTSSSGRRPSRPSSTSGSAGPRRRCRLPVGLSTERRSARGEPSSPRSRRFSERHAMTIGRWEWRGFGEHIEAAQRHFDNLAPNSVEESDETYLLSVRSDASVKVRDDLLDVKRLVQVSDEGLEQWIPIAKDPFPETVTRLDTALAELGVDIPLAREAYTLAELLDEVVAASPDLHAVDVHKRRRRFMVG